MGCATRPTPITEGPVATYIGVARYQSGCRRRLMPTRALSVRRILILSAGWLFIALGVLGLFLPFLQGVLFLMIGFYLLSLESARARLLRRRLRVRYPGLGSKF